MKYIVSLVFLITISSTLFSQKEVDDFTMRQREQVEIEYEATLYEAFSQKMKGNINEAMDLYLKCLKLNPQSSATMYELAQLFFVANDLQASINLMEKAYLLNPLNEWYGLFLLEIYKQKKLFVKGIELCKLLIKKNPSNELNFYELASLYITNNQKSKALSVYSEMEKKFGFSAELYDQKYKLFIHFRDYENATKILQLLIEKFPDEEMYYSDLLILSKELRDVNYSISVAEKYLKIYPVSETINYDLYNLYLSKRDTSRALKQLNVIISNRNFDVQKKYKSLVSLLTDNSFLLDSVQVNFLTINFVETHPNSYESHFIRGEYFYTHKELDKARSEYYLAYKIDKTVSTAYDRLIELEVQANNWQHVYDICKDGLIYFPNNAYLFFYAGIASFELHKYQESINYFLSGLPYVTTKELRSQLFMYLAESYNKTKDYSKCYHFFDKSISTDPTNSVALNNYSYYLSLSKDSLSKALQMTIMSNKLSPNNYVYLDTHAWVLFKMGKYDDALIKIEEAYNKGGHQTGEIIEHYGDILYKLNDTTKAFDMWMKAKKLGIESDILNLKIRKQTYIE